MSWPTATIGSFCTTGSGTTPSRDKAERYYGGGIPWVKSGELREDIIKSTDETVTELALNETALKLAPSGALLVAMYGANVGRVGILGLPATTNQAVCHIIPDPKRGDQRYLFHALQHLSAEFIRRGVGGAQPNINQQIVRNAEIPLPPLDEQRRIAAILDQADAVRRKRHEALLNLNSLAPAIFNEMFGIEYSENNNATRPLGDVIKFITSGGRGWAKYYAASGQRFVRSFDVQMNTIDDEDIIYVQPPDSAEARRTRIESGDILLTITGSKIGRVAVAPKELAGAFVSQHVSIIRIETDRALPSFVCFFLSMNDGGQRQIAKAQRGQSKPGLNFDQIRDFMIPSPEIELQRKFYLEIQAIDQLSSKLEAHLAQLNAFFASLQNRAFRGEL